VNLTKAYQDKEIFPIKAFGNDKEERQEPIGNYIPTNTKNAGECQIIPTKEE